jgi:Protein of unknown function (DUF3048) N-terminal domain/Protein of unknown function (DUF3048) C-terminal domain
MPARSIAAALIAVLVVFAACSDDPEPPVAQSSPSPTPTPTPDPTCPLTGEDVPSGINIKKPAVAVKIENSPAARPQTGLADADVVVEEIVEGGITRFMVIFHCGSNSHAGPVRSARFDDPKIAKPFTKILAYSGANSIVEGELANRKMIALDEDSGSAFFRDPPGVFEVHNLFVDTNQLRSLAERKVRPPSSEVFTFGELPEEAKKAKQVSVNFTASNTIEYRYRRGLWGRWEAGLPFLTSEGDQIAVPNVLIQQVRIDNSTRIFDVAGNPSPDIELAGRGKALLFRDGRVIKGFWDIAEEGAVPEFTTKSGEPMPFAVGPIWIELVPSKEGAVKGSFAFR